MVKNYKLFKGDCLEVLSKVPDNFVDLVLIDPPYLLESHGGGKGKKWDNLQHNDFLKDISSGFDYERCFKLLLQKCKIPNILIFCSNKQISKIMSYFEQDKKLSVTLLCWHKEGYVPFANGKHKSDVEFIVYVRGRNAHWNNDISVDLKSKVLKDNWRIKNKQHPAQKSNEVLEHLINLHSFENDVVLDCFMGSGSTGVACIKLNRKFIGIELEDKYFEIAKKRIELA